MPENLDWAVAPLAEGAGAPLGQPNGECVYVWAFYCRLNDLLSKSSVKVIIDINMHFVPVHNDFIDDAFQGSVFLLHGETV